VLLKCVYIFLSTIVFVKEITVVLYAAQNAHDVASIP